MRQNKLVPALVLLAALQQIAAPPFLFPSGDPTGPLPPRPPSPLEPAGYAFAIWGLVYGAALAYAAYQLLWGRSSVSAAAARAPAIGLYVGSTLWLVAARWLPWATMAIIAVMLALALYAFLAAARSSERTWRDEALVVAPLGLYAGWLTIALFANIGAVAPAYGFAFLNLGERGFALASVAAASLIAIVTLWRARGRLAYAAAVIWALAGLMIANRALGNAELQVALAVAAAGVAAAALGVRFTRRA